MKGRGYESPPPPPPAIAMHTRTCMCEGGSISAVHLFLTIPHACLFLPPPPPSPKNLEYLLAMSKNLARLLHPVYNDGKDGGWKWWE